MDFYRSAAPQLVINVLRSLSGSAKATVNSLSSFSQTVTERLETVIRLESYPLPRVFRRTFWWAQPSVPGPGPEGSGAPLSWDVAEIGGDEGELLRLGTLYYHSHIPVPGIVPSTSKCLLSDHICKGKVPYRKKQRQNL